MWWSDYRLEQRNVTRLLQIWNINKGKCISKCCFSRSGHYKACIWTTLDSIGPIEHMLELSAAILSKWLNLFLYFLYVLLLFWSWCFRYFESNLFLVLMEIIDLPASHDFVSLVWEMILDIGTVSLYMRNKTQLNASYSSYISSTMSIDSYRSIIICFEIWFFIVMLVRLVSYDMLVFYGMLHEILESGMKYQRDKLHRCNDYYQLNLWRYCL